MSYDPRTIAFLAEVLYPPIQLSSDSVQSIYNTLYDQSEISYQSFQVAQDGIHLSNLAEAPGAVSMATFLPDRLLLREELRGTTVDDFATRLVNVARISLEVLEIESSYAQQFIVRSLITPRHVHDSREFLGHRLMAASGPNLHKLGRPIDSLGVRYTFPQSDDLCYQRPFGSEFGLDLTAREHKDVLLKRVGERPVWDGGLSLIRAPGEYQGAAAPSVSAECFC